MNIQGLNQAMGLYTSTTGVSSHGGQQRPDAVRAGGPESAAHPAEIAMRATEDKPTGGTSEVDQEKVERLREEIKNGDYEVDSQSIARKLLNMLTGDNKKSS